VIKTFNRIVLIRFTEAAHEMSKNRDQFLNNVKASMRGGSLKGVQYDNVLAR